MEIKKTKLIYNNNLLIGYTEVKVYKALIDFDESLINIKDFQYEIYGFKYPVKVDDLLYLDLAYEKSKHTYIAGRVLKVLKNKIVIDYDYVDLY